MPNHLNINPNAIDLSFNQGYWHIRFQAMASQCEVLLDSDDKLLAERISQTISKETWRIEQKFSRYRSDNILYEINHCRASCKTHDVSSI